MGMGWIIKRINEVVAVKSPPLFVSKLILVPGIVAAAPYASGDAFGVAFTIPVPSEGTIATVVFHDYDKEGISKELVLFSGLIAGTADNSAFAPTDVELRRCVGVIPITTFYSYNVNQVGIAMPALYYRTPFKELTAQFVTRGTDNIAAGAIPSFTMVVV